MNECHSKESESQRRQWEEEQSRAVHSAREEAYYRGRKESADEMGTENAKLMGIIEQLRGELSQKSKKAIELQF